jgi:arylsulfatase A-like enzyme
MLQRRFYVEGEQRMRFYDALYDAEVRYFDDTFKELMAWMDQEGHLERTIVVFTSDHGESLGDHNYYLEHGRYPYDACSRVPLFIHHPEWQAQRMPRPMGHIDLYPTLMDILNLETPPQAMGRSLVADILGAAEPEEERPIFTESGYRTDFSVAVRLGPWKLITIPNHQLRKEIGCGLYQLFNVEQDPQELSDVFAEHPEVRSQLKPLLEAFKEEAYERYRKPDNQVEEKVELSDETRQLLIDLGYAEDVQDDPDEEESE